MSADLRIVSIIIPLDFSVSFVNSITTAKIVFKGEIGKDTGSDAKLGSRHMLIPMSSLSSSIHAEDEIEGFHMHQEWA
jgi:hypothetical protein